MATSKPASTARPVIESVSTRLGVDAAVLTLLFEACLTEIINQVETEGSCTIRGVGKFSQTQIASSSTRNSKSTDALTLFERPRHVPANRPFKAIGLKNKIAARKASEIDRAQLAGLPDTKKGLS